MESLESDRIELIRNMIREEFDREKKSFLKSDFKNVVIDQFQQLNIDITQLKSKVSSIENCN